MKRAFLPILLASAGLCFAQQTSTAPDVLLKASMDKYSTMKSFSAHCVLSPDFGAAKPPQGADISIPKDIEYQSPNQFELTITIPGAGRIKAVSDGKTMLFIQGNNGISDKAPAAVADLSGHQMLGNPIVACIVFPMTAGSAGYDAFVDTSKGAPKAGSEVTMPDGQKALHVLFAAKGNYGNVDLLIGEQSKLIYNDSFDMGQTMAGQGIKGFKEMYSQVQANPTLSTADFGTAAPAGVKVQSMADMMKASQALQDEQDKPPVPLGSMAPDFKVYSLTTGEPMKLSALRGKVVMIDFWATWCPPCRESLPHTQDIFKQYNAHNVQVVTISDEEAKTIRDFIQTNKYTFPTFRDPGDAAEKAYGITGIPTVVVIDASGKLSAFLVGLRPEDELVSALKRAGAN